MTRLLFKAALAVALSLANSALVVALPAKAQQGPGSSVQELGRWGQRLVEAQQPAIDSFQRCTPTTQRMVALLRSSDPRREEAISALLPQVRTCLADTRAAALATRARLEVMDPMPARVERVLGIDSRDILRRSAIAAGGMASYIERVEKAIDAAIAGDAAAATREWAESTRLAASSIDAQIVLLETLRATLPLETHKGMMDIRLNINRAVRVIAIARELDPELRNSLRRLGADQRAAAAHMRSNWQRERLTLRSAFGGRDNSPLMVAADTAMNRIMVVGEETSTVLERVEGVDEADLIELSSVLAAAEVRIVEAVREMSATVSEAR